MSLPPLALVPRHSCPLPEMLVSKDHVLTFSGSLLTWHLVREPSLTALFTAALPSSLPRTAIPLFPFRVLRVLLPGDAATHHSPTTQQARGKGLVMTVNSVDGVRVRVWIRGI